MKYITEVENDKEGSIPVSGEWAMSLEPGSFTICLINDTEFLPEYDRVSVHCKVGDQVLNDRGTYTSTLKILGLTSLDGAGPGHKIPQAPETQLFVNAVADRLAKAIDGWDAGTPEEAKMALWTEHAIQKSNPLALLEQILSGRFTA